MKAFAEQMTRQKGALELLLRTMANACTTDAESGLFHRRGKRCAFCIHVMKSGDCRLRTIAAQRAA